MALSPHQLGQGVGGCPILPQILLQKQTPNKVKDYQQTEQKQTESLRWSHGAMDGNETAGSQSSLSDPEMLIGIFPILMGFHK